MGLVLILIGIFCEHERINSTVVRLGLRLTSFFDMTQIEKQSFSTLNHIHLRHLAGKYP